ncbi:hypothetical protein [Nannocystis bainbridge]|uniref:Polyketide cyclase / dehydrase and lipid transport n=1 Tax=Nannocystis bainbridge TaxID=2995303 RepID=A0ABT5EBE8_9BACT|nr:hypothetical protein [Nannocystis bainbridge]MDC0723186.1 hypothetical protein [Nannocystis bainbridge]
MTTATYTHVTTTLIEAPVEVVWSQVRDLLVLVRMVFGTKLDEYYTRGWIEGGSVDRVPAALAFCLRSGGPEMVVEGVGRSDREYLLQYCTRGRVMLVADYFGELRLIPTTHPADWTVMVHKREFSVLDGTASDYAAQMVAGMVDFMNGEAEAMRDAFTPKS